MVKHVEPTVNGLTDVRLFMEGVDEEIESAFEMDSVVLRINGPWFTPGSGEDHYRVEALVLMTELVGGDQKYTIYTNAGKVAESLSTPIPVYRYGDGGNLIGCLVPDRNAREFVRVVEYGVIEKDTPVRQMGVLARYEITF